MQRLVAQRWLWVTPAVTDQRATGALVYSLSLADAVAEQGIDVTVVGLGTEAIVSRGVGPRYIAVDAAVQPGWRRLVSIHPNQTAATSVRSFRTTAPRICFERGGMSSLSTACRLRGWHPCSTLPVLDVLSTSVTTTRRACERRSLAPCRGCRARRPLLELDAIKTARLERAVVRRADVVSSISNEDLEQFSQDAPRARHVLVRPGWSAPIERGPPPPMSDRPRRVGILGSFEWHAKQEGLRRFLAVADPVFAREGIQLVVAGKVPDDFRRPLEDALRATRFLGWVENPADVLAECRIGVIAEPLGGGFKLKALDYVFNDVAVASLSHSAAGLPFASGSSMIVGDDEARLVAAITETIDEPAFLERVVLEARRIATDHFSWTAASRSLIDAVVSPTSATP